MTAGRLKGKVALVTGAGSGIGLATARRLAGEGAVVVAGILDDAQRPAAVSEFDALVLDVRSEADWDRAIAHFEAAHGGPDVLVNSAGVHRGGTAEETTAELWGEVMAVNLWGTLLGCKRAIPPMRRRGGGAIVNLASIAAIRGVPGAVAYATSKGGILAMTMALAMDHAADNIRINCVCPGAIDTPIIDGMARRTPDPGAFRAALAARHPLDRLGGADEVAAVIAFLASDDGSFMTGLAIPVDGGRSARG
ncbi:MAG TPA: SDR family NAD(P)-dependent oxidoreductase [Geminicoccaceae bacterium]|nr:SDR family NAD(P)-dependent oxidoreductase [Geminicoccaceae bacterium]